MARPLRIEFPGAVYHVTNRGNEKRSIYNDDKDRFCFFNILSDIKEKYNWIIHTYCLMGNHYHLIVETIEANLSSGMKQLNGVYTQKVNRRHKRAGHLFQGRYKSILLQKDNHLLEACRYTALNPVRAKIVRYPWEYKWSSYNAVMDREAKEKFLTTDWILSQFSHARKKAQKLYKEFVLAGINEKKALHNKAQHQVIFGDESFVNSVKIYLKEKEGIKEIVRKQRYVGRPSIKKVLEDKDGNKGKKVKIRELIYKYGYTQKEIADYSGVHYSTISKILSRE